MNVSQVSKIWLEYHRAHSKHNTVRAYQFTIAKFSQHFSNRNLNEVSADDILDFMAKFTEGRKPQTERIRFSHLTAFFNFMRNNLTSRNFYKSLEIWRFLWPSKLGSHME